ncbi:UNVERIFIED_CONTAM: hypothetical protein Sangu_3225700 [Sesamum angustifolium]|uniref:Uncharacterized protein n=1 Tax=Sesamum angustifolium TaxID=2727405 RepID=A0AAW2JI34_9LAMI
MSALARKPLRVRLRASVFLLPRSEGVFLLDGFIPYTEAFTAYASATTTPSLWKSSYQLNEAGGNITELAMAVTDQ